MKNTPTLAFHLFSPVSGIVLLALVLRLFFVLVWDPSPNFKGGDANWYMANGRDLVSTGKTAGPLQTPPLYLVFVGVVQVAFPGHASSNLRDYTRLEMQVIRVIQSILGAILCLFVYLAARRFFSERVGWLAAGILAISPALVIEAGNLTTEGMFMFFVFGGLALYALSCAQPTPRALAVVGIIFGLATLTRAVFFLFPLGIAVHLWLTHRTRWIRLSLGVLVSYGLIISTWTVYNLIVWDRLVIGGEGFLSLVQQGTTGQMSPQQADAALGSAAGDSPQSRNAALRKQIEKSITRDPLGWTGHRVKELGKAYLQPHNTVHFNGPSIRQLASEWLHKKRSLRGLIDLTHTESFWPKLLLYVFHFGGLLLGSAGMWVGRRQWRTLLPLYGMIVYFTTMHLILLALPRYLFPLYPVFWIFAAGFTIAVWDRWHLRRSEAPVVH